MRWLDHLVFRRAAPRAIRYLEPPDYDRATGLEAAVLAQLDDDFLVGPPLTLHMPDARLFAAVWGVGRECLTVGREGRPMREAVGAAVSMANACPYCVDVHAASLHGLGQHAVADAVLAGEEVADPRIRELVSWGLATLAPGSEILRRPPFTAAEAPQIIGTATCFHYLNRMVNVFLDPSPVPAAGGGGGRLKRAALRAFGVVMRRRLARQDAVAGRFLLDAGADAALPAEFGWAASNAAVAGSFVRLAAAAEEAGRRAVDPEVRALVEEVVQAWSGTSPGLSRSWVEGPASRLDEALRPAARLALLTALAAYQVDEAVVAAFRARAPGDRELVDLTAWSSFVATRRIAGWLAPAAVQETARW